MNISTGIRMFPLQAPDLLMFQLPVEGFANEVMFFLIGVGVVVLIFIIVSIFKSKGKIPALSEGYVPAKRRRNWGVSTFTLRRIAHEMGLDREQTRMLEFILRNGNVTDPKKSLDSPELMDKHFKRAYWLIEQTAISEEELNRRLSVLFSIRNTIEVYFDNVTIESTHQIPENATAVLVLDDLNYPTKVLSSRGELLIVEHPVDSRGVPASIPKGKRVNLTFFIKTSKGFSAASRVVGFMETMNRRIIKLAHSNKVKKLSSRRFRRRRTAISTSFYLVHVETGIGMKQKRLIVDKRQFVGNIMDISVGGCSIKTTSPIKAGYKVKIEFTREDSLTVAALGEVLRTNRTGYNTVMHIKFLKIPRKSLNFINAMVYEYANN